MKTILFIIVLAFAAIGAATGYSVGLSQSPVVATVLPLLFGLIAGGSGFILSGTRLDVPWSRRKLFPSLMAIAIFSISYLGSMWHGMVIRQPDHSLSIEHPSFTEDLTLPQALSLIQYRKALHLSGASKAEQEAIIQSFFDRMALEAPTLNASQACQSIDLASIRLIDALNALEDPIVQANASDLNEVANLLELSNELTGLRRALDVCGSLSTESVPPAGSIVFLVAKEMLQALNRYIVEREVNTSADSPWNALNLSSDGPEAFANLHTLLKQATSQQSSVLSELLPVDEIDLSSLSLEVGTAGRGLASTEDTDPFDGFPG